MKFGMLLMSQRNPETDMQQALNDMISWVHRARDLGFDYVSLGQHFLTSPYQQLQTIPLMARLAPESGRMGLLSTLITPLHNPVELAETLGTVDVITGGRYMVNFALGYRDDEYRAFGVDPKHRVSRMVETIEVLRRLWTQDKVTFHGRHWHLDNASVVLKPVQKPHPPMSIGANADAAVARAARMGLPWNVNGHATFDTIARQVRLYRETAAEAGHNPDVLLPLGRELYCAPTRQQAFEEAAPFLGEKYAAYNQWGQQKALPGEEDWTVGFRELAKDRFIIGSPDDCARELERFMKLGIGRAQFRMNWGGMPTEHVIRGMDLFAEKVMPHFR